MNAFTKYPQTKRLGRAQATVEFAFSVVAFLMLLFGIIGFGIAVYDYNFVSDAAREGARYASVHGKDSLTPLTTAGASSTVRTFILNEANGINPNKLTVTVNPILGGNNTSPADFSPGNAAQVIVTYNASLPIPLFAQTLTLTSSSQMVISQ
ncbi:MAG: TadE/TadG family type IV pilus assembly protein [Candidatus Binataceae bacterium]